jgi:hypothetical protein
MSMSQTANMSMYQASVPMIKTLLTAFSAVLDKGAAFATAKKIDPSVLITARLAPDMLPLSKQVQIASDISRRGIARLCGQEAPAYSDDEADFDALKARLAKTIAYVDGFPAVDIDASYGRDITMKMGGEDVTFVAERYLVGFVIPNVVFHAATGYNILRHNGVEIGKRDFLGAF